MQISLLTQKQPQAFLLSDWLIAFILALTTLALHAWQTLGIENTAGQFSKYPLAANKFLDGSLTADRLFDFSPTYLWLCALTARVSDQPFQTLQWVQLILVALTAASLYLLLRSYFHRGLALFGTVAFSLNPSVIIYSYIFEPEPVLMFLLVTSLLMARLKSTPGSFIAGFTVLLSILTRPVHMLLVAAFPLYIWLQLENRRLMAYAAFLLPVACGILGFAFYSLNHVQIFPPPVMNPGVVFFEGNNPLATGNGAAYPPLIAALGEDFPSESDYQHSLYRLVARRDTGRNLSPREVNHYWSDKALKFIGDEPAHALALLGKKALYIFHSYRWADIQAAFKVDEALQAGHVPLFPLAPVSALAIFGLALGLRIWRDFFLPYVVFFSQAGVMLLTYASDRQRVGLIPLIIFFALVGLTEILRKSPRKWLAIMVLIPLTVLLSHNTQLMRDNRQKWVNFNQMLTRLQEAKNARDAFQFNRASELTARAWAVAPWANSGDAKLALIPATPAQLTIMALNEPGGSNSTVSLNRALLLIKAGRLKDAEALLSNLQQKGQSYERALNRVSYPAYYLGQIAALNGDRKKAESLLIDTLDKAPGDPAILARLAILSGSQRYKERLNRYFGHLGARVQLGKAALELGYPVQAVDALQPVQKLLPEYWEGQMFLAAALADTARDAEAVDTFLNAMGQRSEPMMFQGKILPAFLRWAKTSSPETNPRYWYGRVLSQYGLFDEARLVLQTSLNASGRTEVAEELNRVELIMRKSDIYQ